MNAQQPPVVKDLVLIGGGHSHVAVLRRFGMRPLPGVRVTLVCRDAHTPYSGMLPGYIAGHYTYDEAHIDLEPLARFAGARFYHDEVSGLDPDTKLIHCLERPPVPYDLVSINVGSAPALMAVPGAAREATPVKPINRFLARWTQLLDDLTAQGGAPRIAVVGAGAGGVELTLALQHRLRGRLRDQGRSATELELHLFEAAPHILPGHASPARRRFERVLARRGVHVHTGEAVERVEAGVLHTDHNALSVNEVLWVTAAGGPAWLAGTPLALDARGFVRVDPTLRAVSHPSVFAAGDVASIDGHPREKAGVFAVRMGPPLARNLRRVLTGRAPRRFRPQRRYLALISTGNRYAVGSRGRLTFAGDWVWRWKNRIDQRFMARYRDLPRMATANAPAVAPGVADDAAQTQLTTLAMRCGGCGAKVGSSTLERVLTRLEPHHRDDVIVGLGEPDDAAVVSVPPGRRMVHSVDFFPAFVDDPYVLGQVAANHSLGDLYAMNAEPQSALALATIPHGLEVKVEDTLYQLLAGALRVFESSGTALAGGHTSEGAELSIGFAVNGHVEPAAMLRKRGMRPGDALILTKPLGTGTLFAADMRGQAKGRWIHAAIASMLQPNHDAARCLHRYGASACTDVTGFGLLGHLVEMAQPSGVSIDLDLAALPILTGAAETLGRGYLSSLQPENLRLQRAIHNPAEVVAHERYPLIFDPQTSGGLAASVPRERARGCVEALHRLGYAHAVVIGRVASSGDRLERVRLVA